MRDYARGVDLGTVTGADPFIAPAFEGSLLLRVRPCVP